MLEPEIFRDLKSRVDRAFSSPVRAPGRSRNEQLEWWARQYRPRSEGHERFLSFLEDPSFGICRVTGQIGSGKTTFALSKLEDPASRQCDGIWIDIGTVASELQEAETKAIREFTKLKARHILDCKLADWIDNCVTFSLNKLIAKEVERRFRRHFWWLQCGLSWDYLDIDVWNRLDIACTEPSSDEYEIMAGEVARNVAAALVLVRPDDNSVAIRESAFRNFPDARSTTRLERLRALSAHFCSNPQHVSDARTISDDLPGAQLVVHWLRAFSLFFRVERPILLIDNVDRVFSTELHAAIIAYARRLANELRNNRLQGGDSKAGQFKRPQEFKVVFTVRDWNMRSPTRHFAGEAIREMGIALGKEPAGYVDLHAYPVFLPLEKAHLGEVIDARASRIMSEVAQDQEEVAAKLAAAKDKTVAAQYQERLDRLGDLSRLVRQFSEAVRWVWDVDSEQTDQLPLEQLTNHSIRGSLSVAARVALGVIEDSGGDPDMIRARLMPGYRVALRNYVIDWIFDTDASGHDLGTFIRDELNLVRSSDSNEFLCCPYRIILTYLYNLYKNGPRNARTIVGELIRHINTNCGTPEASIKNSLRFLFQSGQLQADYVTIYQQRPIEEPSDIDDRAVVHINPRGIALLQRVMPRIDYWAQLCGYRRPLPSVFELPPQEAYDFVEPIVSLICRMEGVHRRNWLWLIRDHMLGLANDDLPFDRYCQANLAYGRTFYVQRVANSHRHVITGYVRALMEGPEVAPGMPYPKRVPGEPEWPRFEGELPAPRDAMDKWERAVDDYGRTLPNDQAALLRRLYELADQVDQVWRRMRALSTLTYSQSLQALDQLQ